MPSDSPEQRTLLLPRREGSGDLKPGTALQEFVIDKLLGQGEQLLRSGFEKGAHRLLDQLGSVHDDDRALLLLHRRDRQAGTSSANLSG